MAGGWQDPKVLTPRPPPLHPAQPCTSPRVTPEGETDTRVEAEQREGASTAWRTLQLTGHGLPGVPFADSALHPDLPVTPLAQVQLPFLSWGKGKYP